jgi:hypothetical protein
VSTCSSFFLEEDAGTDHGFETAGFPILLPPSDLTTFFYSATIGACCFPFGNGLTGRLGRALSSAA